MEARQGREDADVNSDYSEASPAEAGVAEASPGGVSAGAKVGAGAACAGGASGAAELDSSAGSASVLPTSAWLMRDQTPRCSVATGCETIGTIRGSATGWGVAISATSAGSPEGVGDMTGDSARGDVE